MSRSTKTNEMLSKYAYAGDVEGVGRMLEDGGDMTWRDYSRNLHPPMIAAMFGGHVRVIELLIKHGADLNKRENKGQISLHFAASMNQPEVARLLIEHGANVNRPDNYMETPLYAAALMGAKKVAKVLLEHGADVNQVQKENEYPLHAAAFMGQVEVAQLLLEHRAPVDMPDMHGRTAFHRAAKSEQVNIAKLLAGWGADPNVVDEKGRTALNYAICGPSYETLGNIIGPVRSPEKATKSGNRESVQGSLRQSIVQKSVEEMISRYERVRNEMEMRLDCEWKRTLAFVLYHHKIEMLYFAFQTEDTEKRDAIINWAGSKKWVETATSADSSTLMPLKEVSEDLDAVERMLWYDFDIYAVANDGRSVSEAAEIEKLREKTRDMITEIIKPENIERAKKIVST